MKCIYCETNNTYPERVKNSQRCSKCHHPFAMEPKTDPLQISDGLFQRVIRDVSDGEKLFFTEQHLWYEFNRRLLKHKTLSCGAAATLLLVAGGAGFAMHHLGPALLGMSGLCFAATTTSRASAAKLLRPKISLPDFDSRYLSKWVNAHGQIPKLLPPPAPSRGRLHTPQAQDITSYSFDRALVTEHADIAAMLVANNFHFENNCAILSLDGYPYQTAATVMEMLMRNPQLKVFALHDASVRGCEMPGKLRQTPWFPDPTIRLIDLGLRPKHIEATKLITLQRAQTTVPDPLRATLIPGEILWLESGNVTELTCMRPAKLMRAIYQGFARANQMEAEGMLDSTMTETTTIWVYDGGADVYAADSFG